MNPFDEEMIAVGMFLLRFFYYLISTQHIVIVTMQGRLPALTSDSVH